ncbi:MAG: phosphoribosyltransferase family protein [Patescibacteria group bacterium]
MLERIATYNITVDGDENFIDMITGENLNHIGKKYSLMKFGSYQEILFFGKKMSEEFILKMKDKANPLKDRIERIKKNKEFSVFISPSSRNVESPHNFITEVAMNYINMWLSLNNLPTFILVKLPKLTIEFENYSSLSLDDRIVKMNNDTTIPLNCRFRKRQINIFFSDDAYITGITEDHYRKMCENNEAQSFFSMYSLIVDPKVINHYPGIEHRLNTYFIKGELNDVVAKIINHREFRVTERIMRLIFSEKNRAYLTNFLLQLTNSTALIKIYHAAINNDFLHNEKYTGSVLILQDILRKRLFIDDNGNYYLNNI